MNRSDYLEIRNQLCFKKKLGKLINHIIVDISILIVAFYGSSLKGLCFASYVLLAAFFLRSFAIMHDAAHGSVLDSKFLNNAIGYIYGCFCMLPFFSWKELHLQHHLWAGNLDRDPVMKLVKNFPNYSPEGKHLVNFFWKSWIPLMAFLQQVVFWSESLYSIQKNKKKRIKTAALFSFFTSFAFISLMLYGLIHFFTPLGVLTSLLIYWLAIETVNFPHHLDMPYHVSQHKVWDQHLVSRTCRYPEFICRWVLLNFNYHSEHHMFPTLPYYELSKAHDLLKTNYMSKTETFYQERGLEWILKNRKLSFGQIINKPPDVKKAHAA